MRWPTKKDIKNCSRKTYYANKMFNEAVDACKKAYDESRQPTGIEPNQQAMHNLDYAISLQRAIEYHCKDKIVPEHIAKECPHHAEMLNNSVGTPKERLVEWPKKQMIKGHENTCIIKNETIDQCIDAYEKAGFGARPEITWKEIRNVIPQNTTNGIAIAKAIADYVNGRGK